MGLNDAILDCFSWLCSSGWLSGKPPTVGVKWVAVWLGTGSTGPQILILHWGAVLIVKHIAVITFFGLSTDTQIVTGLELWENWRGLPESSGSTYQTIGVVTRVTGQVERCRLISWSIFQDRFIESC
uniref:(northern house mosquito) hypothetical protein n=1 Tax=Culex pipiens TaxID=7175 RepID=A0A8D8CVY3_CULPI